MKNLRIIFRATNTARGSSPPWRRWAGQKSRLTVGESERSPVLYWLCWRRRKCHDRPILFYCGIWTYQKDSSSLH